MSNKLREIDMKNRTCHFFHDMINIKNLHPNKIKIYENLYKTILIHHIGYQMVKNLRYTKSNSANPLYLIIDKINEYFGESNGNKYR